MAAKSKISPEEQAKQDKQKLEEQERKEKEKKLKQRDKQREKYIKSSINFPFRTLWQVSLLGACIMFLIKFFGQTSDIVHSLYISFLTFIVIFLALGLLLITLFYVISESKKQEKELDRKRKQEERRQQDKQKQEELARFEQMKNERKAEERASTESQETQQQQTSGGMESEEGHEIPPEGPLPTEEKNNENK